MASIVAWLASASDLARISCGCPVDPAVSKSLHSAFAGARWLGGLAWMFGRCGWRWRAGLRGRCRSGCGRSTRNRERGTRRRLLRRRRRARRRSRGSFGRRFGLRGRQRVGPGRCGNFALPRWRFVAARCPNGKGRKRRFDVRRRGLAGRNRSGRGAFPAATIARPNRRAGEKVFLAGVLQLARRCGWLAYHTHDSRRSEPGFPDLVATRGGRVVFAELKTARGRVSAAQRAWLEALGKTAGPAVSVFVWTPEDWAAIEATLARRRPIRMPSTSRQ